MSTTEKTARDSPARKPDFSRKRSVILDVVKVLLLLSIFLIGIRGLGSGFKGLGGGLLDSFFAATTNPFIALTVGILATTLLQSSSVTTSMIVALVAAPDNPLPIENAVPMIMGANIGTTVTNTLVSLMQVSRDEEFRRAFAAATCHDFFNFITVAILLPLEMATGTISSLAKGLASVVGTGGGGKFPNPIKEMTKIGLKPIENLAHSVTGDKQVFSVILLIISAVIIFVSLFLLVKVLRDLAATRLQAMVSRSLGKSGIIGIIVGVVVTVMVQSSSITTSVMVPLAAAGIVTLQQVFPITIGANIGTTLTAILASMAAPSETAHLGVQIALVHLMFNLMGTVLVYPWKITRNIPIRMAEKLAGVAVKHKSRALLYVAGLFYGVPALLIAISRMF